MSERELGMHAEAINTLKTEVAALRDDIGEIKEMLAGANGGWKTLMLVGGAASAAGAVIAFIVGLFR